MSEDDKEDHFSKVFSLAKLMAMHPLGKKLAKDFQDREEELIRRERYKEIHMSIDSLALTDEYNLTYDAERLIVCLTYKDKFIYRFTIEDLSEYWSVKSSLWRDHIFLGILNYDESTKVEEVHKEDVLRELFHIIDDIGDMNIIDEAKEKIDKEKDSNLWRMEHFDKLIKAREKAKDTLVLEKEETNPCKINLTKIYKSPLVKEAFHLMIDFPIQEYNVFLCTIYDFSKKFKTSFYKYLDKKEKFFTFSANFNVDFNIFFVNEFTLSIDSINDNSPCQSADYIEKSSVDIHKIYMDLIHKQKRKLSFQDQYEIFIEEAKKKFYNSFQERTTELYKFKKDHNKYPIEVINEEGIEIIY